MKKPATLVASSLWVSLLAPLLIVVGLIGARAGLMRFDSAVGIATRTADGAVLVSAAIAIAALFGAASDFRRLGPTALAALLITGVIFAGEARWYLVKHASVPVHDVSTNWSDPVGFSNELMTARQGAENPVEDDPHVPASAGPPWGGMRVADVNAKSCPGAKAIPHGVDVDKVSKVLQANGFQVLGAQVFLVEGTTTGFWFGATDDIAVRIRPERTDIRIVRRDGRTDNGDNCARITRIVQALSR